MVKRNSGGDKIMLVAYMDDILVTNDEKEIKGRKAFLGKEFE